LVEQAHPRQVIAAQRTNCTSRPSWLLSCNCVTPRNFLSCIQTYLPQPRRHYASAYIFPRRV
jgi:hypothetical protein